MTITVIGCGRWGSFIAWYLNKIGHTVTLYGRTGSARMQLWSETRSNGLLTLPQEVRLTTSLAQAMRSECVVVSIGAQGLRHLMEETKPYYTEEKVLVLCMKGVEIATGMRLTQVAKDVLGRASAAVWLGPGHVQEFCTGVPNCMVIDAEDETLEKRLVKEFSSELIRFYYGSDLVGNELGAAAKNVIGIAAGMLDGLGLSSLKGALMSRATREIARLIEAEGGDGRSAYGLCHLGDYEATVFSPFSHNRRYGEAFVRGEPYGELAEGCYTVKALLGLSEKNSVELPICRAVYAVLYEKRDAKEVLNSLFLRSIKQEF